MARWLIGAVLALASIAMLVRRADDRRSDRSAAPTSRPAPRQAISYAQARHLVIVAIFLVLGIWLFLWFADRAREVLTLLAISGILAIALRPSVDRLNSEQIPLTNRRVPRALAILLLYLVIALIAAVLLLLVVPQLGQESQRLLENVPRYVDDFEAMLNSLQQYPFVPDLSALQGQIFSQLIGGVSQALDVLLFAVNIATALLSTGVILVLTFFLLMEAEPLHDHLVSLLPPTRQSQARAMSAKMGRRITGWMRGILIMSAFIGISTTIGMWLLGMPFPLLLGLAAGLFEFIPMVGAYLGAAPAVILALFQPTWKLVVVIVFFVVLQQLENNVLAPTVMGREVEMPALLVIVALLMGGALMGIIGALLAVPVGAILQVLWTDLVVPEIRKRQAE